MNELVLDVDTYDDACRILGLKPKKFTATSPYQGIFAIFEQLRTIVTAYNYVNNCYNVYIPFYDGRYNHIAEAKYVLKNNSNIPQILLYIKTTEHLLSPIDLVFCRNSVGYACLRKHANLWYKWFSYSNIKTIYNRKLIK